MQWDGSANAGFCTPNVTPWLPVADDYQIYNVAHEQHDPRSFLMLTRRLLELRRTFQALTTGSYQSMNQDNNNCFVYLRQHARQRCLVVLNFSTEDQVVELSMEGKGRILLSTHADREELLSLSILSLRGNEGLLIEVEG